MRDVLRKMVSVLVLCTFLLDSTGIVFAQLAATARMPEPGSMSGLSQPMIPASLQGLKVDLKEPFRFQFILSPGEVKETSQDEVDHLVRDFFTALTIPQNDIWVNLSPLEHDRVVMPDFGRTQMGRELLFQDYMLKQVASSLMYPEEETGKVFWNKVYEKAHDLFGTTNIPTDVFNKVWIVSSKARIYERGGAVYITEDSLDVMLDSDHALMEANGQSVESTPAQEISREVIRQTILPIIRKEVNEGAQFASLRQIHRALILAKWYKTRLKDSLLARAYADQNKIEGVTHGDPAAVENIYNNYVEAFKRGVYNYVREDQDPYTGEVIPRKYFAGGMAIDPKLEVDSAENVKAPDTGLVLKTIDASPIGSGISKLAGTHAFQKTLLSTGMRLVRRLALLGALSVFLASSGYTQVSRDVHAGDFNKKALLAVGSLEDPNTKLVPSHVGMPQFENIAFVYDLAVLAGVFKAAGEEAYARTIMDFFMNGLSNPDLVKTINGQVGFVTDINVNTGTAGGESLIGAGPNAWIGLSALNVDPQKYKPLALAMGNLLLSLQNAQGGVVDGNRASGFYSVVTEPHMDAVALFYALHKAYGGRKWKNAAKKGMGYFKLNIYESFYRVIGRRPFGSVKEFATDAYSWTLLGRVGEELPLKELKTHIDTMLKKSLVRVTAPIPGGEVKTMTLADFTDPLSSFAIDQRGGVHPLGSVEWTGGVIMAVQKAAIRFAESGDKPTAQLYKGIAEELLKQAQSAFGKLDHSDGLIAYYATEGGVPTGHGWKTPFPDDLVRGSMAGYWIIYPMTRMNPFTGENYGAAYDAIGIDVTGATDFINTAVQGKEYFVVNIGDDRTEKRASGGEQSTNISSGGSDLLKGRTPAMAKGYEWKSSYVDLDMTNGIPVTAGQKIKVSLMVNGANRVLVGLVGNGNNPADYPIIQKIVDVVNHVVEVELIIPKYVYCINRVVVAHGESAWAESVGHQNSVVTFKKITLVEPVKPVKDDAQNVGGIDLKKIDLHVDAGSSAGSVEVNDAVVASFQEGLLGLEPVTISSVPLLDLQGFLRGVR